MDSSSWKAYGKIDPELEAMVPNMPNSTLGDYPDVPSLRQGVMDQVMEGIKAGIFSIPDLGGIRKEEIHIPARDGYSIRALHYRSEGGETGPVVVLFHGGGWVFGMPEMFEKHVVWLCKELGFVVVAVEYRKAPEDIFPTAANDAVDAVNWVGQNAAKLGAEPFKGFIVGGSSAGANLTAVATHEAADAKLSPPITGVWLQVPCLVHSDAVPEQYKAHYNSYEEFKDAMVLDRKAMNLIYTDNYKPDPKSLLFNTLLRSGHKSQPPTYFQVCGMDPLRDEGLIYEYALRKDGVPTKLDIYPGIPHSGLDFMPFLSQSKKGVDDLKSGFQWLLSKK
ncbi:alpha/beta-hydrolase [Lindgomyces ingoldianus]|uniref:Alpha/beta-hydrolase n=1 Tax=Lindgomyces ingoldianus TaxID=673940 RepID=A0ACB6QCW8_9PLEO|nr:alpha/beta-hydrolase [Lindgomyces ingoldianus]KAF2464453.1 alpha/beta-hydrolase [Lindgomyces ingoldianus]